MLQPPLEPAGAILEALAHCPGAGGQAALIEGHQEANRTRPGIIHRRGAGTLALHEARNLAVQLELVAVEKKVDRVGNSLGEDLLRRPASIVAALRKVDHRFLGAAQVKWSALAIHGLLNRSNVGVSVSVQQLEKEREVLRVALVRGRGQEEEVIRRVAKQLAELVALALVRLVAGRHAMGLVHNYEVPVDLAQPRQDVLPLREIERRDDPLLLEPLVDAKLITQVGPLQDHKLLVEFFLQLPLPLECEIGRTDD